MTITVNPPLIDWPCLLVSALRRVTLFAALTHRASLRLLLRFATYLFTRVESNQRESAPDIRVSLRSTPLAPALFRGSARRAIHGPACLVWHPCQTPLSTPPPLGLLTGFGDRVVCTSTQDGLSNAILINQSPTNPQLLHSAKPAPAKDCSHDRLPPRLNARRQLWFFTLNLADRRQALRADRLAACQLSQSDAPTPTAHQCNRDSPGPLVRPMHLARRRCRLRPALALDQNRVSASITLWRTHLRQPTA
jgi:hypothetical protein